MIAKTNAVYMVSGRSALLAMALTGCLHAPADNAPATPSEISQCRTDATVHGIETVSAAVLSAASLGFEWGALELASPGPHQAAYADVGAILGAVGLAAGIASAVTERDYEDDGCSGLTAAALKRAARR